jgi:hypothetical protein
VTTAAQRGARLRIGFLIDTNGPLQPWDQRLVHTLRRDPRFDLAAVLVDARAHVARRPAPEFEGIARLDSKGAATAAAELGVDVIVNFGTSVPSVELRSAPQFGVWSLEVSGRLLGRTDRAAYRDSARRRPTISVELVVRSGALEVPQTVARADFNRDLYSRDQQSAACEKAVALMVRGLRRLANDEQLPQTSPVLAPSPAIRETPLALAQHTVSKWASVGGKVSKRARMALGRRPMMWSLFLGQGEPSATSFAASRELVPPKGAFWADPFLFERRGKTYVFFENYIYSEKRGKLSVGVINGQKFEVLGDVLDLGCHLSFPYVFEHGGDVFLMPEMCERRRVEIYRAVNFPLTWTLHATALHDQSVADPVLFEDQGQWWLFANVSETPFEDHCNELHAFSVDGPALRRVVPHTLNPIVVGARTARNGGRIVREGGRLLRWSQCNSDGIYGRGLQVMDITRLDEHGYEESVVESFNHGFKRGLIGIHHFDRSGSTFIVDGCRRWG